MGFETWSYHSIHFGHVFIRVFQLSCEKLYGAHLAEISDATENNFIINEVNSLGSTYWVGGNDLQIEGEWKWYSSNQKITYSTWFPGNPSNSAGDENCMEIHDGDGSGPQKPLWNDNQCHVFLRYICEKTASVDEIIG